MGRVGVPVARAHPRPSAQQPSPHLWARDVGSRQAPVRAMLTDSVPGVPTVLCLQDVHTAGDASAE
jgi:hypothetical protein